MEQTNVQDARAIRVVIGGDDEQQIQQVMELLGRNGVDCPLGCAIPLDLTTDRAARLNPDLLLVLMSTDVACSLAAIQEAQNTVSAHVLAVGPALDASLILKTLHEGADEYLDASKLETELPAALTRWRARNANHRKSNKAGNIISVLSASGGSGGTTVAANVATLLAKRYGRCGLIDLRLEAGDLQGSLNLDPEHNVAEFCDNAARMDRTMFEQMFVPHKSGVGLLAAPCDHEIAKRVTPRGLRLLMAMSRTTFPYTVVDLDNRISDEQSEVFWQSDRILIVLRLDFTSIRNARRILVHLENLGVARERLMLIANRHKQPKELSVKHAEDALGMRIDHFVPDDPARANRAVNRGVPIVTSWPRCGITRSLIDLTVKVNGRDEGQ